MEGRNKRLRVVLTPHKHAIACTQLQTCRSTRRNLNIYHCRAQWTKIKSEIMKITTHDERQILNISEWSHPGHVDNLFLNRIQCDGMLTVWVCHCLPWCTTGHLLIFGLHIKEMAPMQIQCNKLILRHEALTSGLSKVHTLICTPNHNSCSNNCIQSSEIVQYPCFRERETKAQKWWADCHQLRSRCQSQGKVA